MRKETLRNVFVAGVLGLGAAVGIKAAENPTIQAANIFPDIPKNHLVIDRQNLDTGNELNDFQKVGVTFLVSAEVLGIALLGYRFSDGARNKTEKYGWLVGVPSANLVGAAFLLSEMWR